jgi:TonB family protein
MLTADETLTLDARIAPPVDKRQRNFMIALGFALLVHVAFLVEVSRGISEREMRRVGAENGSDNAIAVELVTEKDLQSLSSVSLQPGGAPAMKPSVQPEQAPPPPAEPPPTPEPQPEPTKAAEPLPELKAEPTPEPKIAEPPPPEPKTAEPTVTAEAKAEPSETKPPPAPAFEPLNPDLADMPSPSDAKEAPPPEAEKEESPPEAKKVEPEAAEKKLEPEPAKKQVQPEPAQKQVKPETAEKAAKPQPPAKKKQQQAKLDFAPPPAMPGTSSGGPGRATAATRPPGITRSGENDRFGIAAIRALAQTFPMLKETYGRVTVRLLLNQNGDLVDVRVVAPSGKPGLDQSVVFSTKQASFPLPPRNSTEIDRTFIVTYVYR